MWSKAADLLLVSVRHQRQETIRALSRKELVSVCVLSSSGQETACTGMCVCTPVCYDRGQEKVGYMDAERMGALCYTSLTGSICLLIRGKEKPQNKQTLRKILREFPQMKTFR